MVEDRRWTSSEVMLGRLGINEGDEDVNVKVRASSDGTARELN
jgi:hypothetical protein